jgi:hypothetical protein
MATETETAEGQRKHIEREFEVGKDEAWFANIKRTYDEFQQESLESVRRNRTFIDKVLTDTQQYDNQRQNIANQSLQNAVETANMVSKQAVRHSDLAIDRQWNVDEVAQLIAKTPVFLDAIAAAVAKKVNT